MSNNFDPVDQLGCATKEAANAAVGELLVAQPAEIVRTPEVLKHYTAEVAVTSSEAESFAPVDQQEVA
jgi:hypothetical protein